MDDNKAIEVIDRMTADSNGKLEVLVLKGCQIPSFTEAIKTLGGSQ